MRHPVDEPEEIANESYGHQQHQLQLVVLQQTNQDSVKHGRYRELQIRDKSQSRELVHDIGNLRRPDPT